MIPQDAWGSGPYRRYRSIFRELIAKVMINYQRVGIRGIYYRWCRAAALVNDNDVFGVSALHCGSLDFIMYCRELANKMDLNQIRR